MRNIAHHHHEIHRLPLFQWADSLRKPATASTFSGYRVDRNLTVTMLRKVVRHG